METRDWINPSGRPLKEEPATYLQLSWLSALDSPVCIDSLAFTWDLRGQLDLDVLRETVRRLVVRHESLRTNYVRDEAGVRQVVWPPEVPDLPLVDLSTLAPGDAEAEAQRAIEAEIERSLVLTESALWRGFVVRIVPDHHVLVIAGHHSLIDSASQWVLHTDLCRIYRDVSRGHADTVPSLPAQLADYAKAQRTPLSPHAETYWRRQLGATEPLNLPYARSWRPGRFHVILTEWPTIAATEIEALRKVAESVGASLGTALRAAVAAALSPFADDAVVIGVVYENRKPPEHKGLIGAIAGHLPVRVDVSGNPSFVELVARANRAWNEARRFSAPLGTIRRAVGAGQEGDRRLYDVVVNWYREPSWHRDPAALPRDELPGAHGKVLTMAARPATGSPQAEFDHEFDSLAPLTIVLFSQADGSLVADLCTANTAFTKPTTEMFGRMFSGVIAAGAGGSTDGVRNLARSSQSKRRHIS